MHTPIATRSIHFGAASGRRRSSVTVWLALMAYLVAVKLVITLVPAAFRSTAQAAVFGWPCLAVWSIAGLIGIWFARRTGFPEAWDARVSNRQRFVIPALVGLAFGVPFIAHDVVTHYSQIIAAQRGLPGANIALPAALVIYPGGAIIVEVVYRLLALPLLLWLISNVLLRGRGQLAVFVVLALLSSLIEPLTQDLDALPLGLAVFGSLFALDFALNVAQVTLFRKYGLLSAIVMRVAFYGVWHMLYVH